jgi:transcriptional regulator with XRE-family HTH domain
MGEFLRVGRERSKKTQLELSQRIGYSSQQYISNFERGFCFPTNEALKVYISECGVSKREIKKMLLRQLSERIDDEL